MRGAFGLIGALLIALFAGGIGYWIGISSETVPVATGAVAYGWGFPFFPFFGLLFGFLFILLIISIARRAWGGPGWYGRGGWYGPGQYGPHDHEGKTVPPPFQPMLDDWHRRAHSQPAAGPAPTNRPPA